MKKSSPSLNRRQRFPTWRFQPLSKRLSQSIILAAIILTANPIVSADEQNEESQQPKLEQGVRLRAYQIKPTGKNFPQLAQGQSANLDRTIPDYELEEDAPYWEDVELPLIIHLDSLLKINTPGDYDLLLRCEAPVTLQIGKQKYFSSEDDQGPRATVALKAGSNPIHCEVLANEELPELELLIRKSGENRFRSVKKSQLLANAFYFRPTSPGFKRLADSNDRPGLREKVAGVHPSFDLTTMRRPNAYVPVGGLDMLQDGTLVVATFDARKLRAPNPQEEPDGELWLYHNAEGDPANVRREKIAEQLYEPSGVCVVGDAIYVSQRLEVTRFDQNKEGEWKPTTIASGWESNDFHALSFGLLHEPGEENHPGYLYMAKGSGLGLGENPPLHGSVWRIDLSLPEGENVEPVSGGHRTPNGLGWGPEGTLFVTDNQGNYTPANELNLVQEGAFYGYFHWIGEDAEPTPFQPEPFREDHPEAITEASVWLPQDEIANSPSEPVLIPENWPYAGQMLVGDVKYGGINRISLQSVGGVWQGCAYRFTQGLEGGINRITFGPKGSLFAGAIGGDHAATWNWVDPDGRKTYQGLQRLNPNKTETFDIESVELKSKGFLVRFTQPISEESCTSETIKLSQWTYRATEEYGGPKRGHTSLSISKIKVAGDGQSVFLEVDGIKTNHVVHLTLDPTSRNGKQLWSSEAWYTVRRLPDSQNPKPTKVVFVTGDDEYRSELSMPMIASILEKQSNYKVRILRAVDEEGFHDRHGNSIPGLRSLRDADLAIFFMRFRQLPDAQVKEIEDYIASGRPVIGLRTSTHAFDYESGPHEHLNDGFGDKVAWPAMDLTLRSRQCLRCLPKRRCRRASNTARHSGRFRSRFMAIRCRYKEASLAEGLRTSS